MTHTLETLQMALESYPERLSSVLEKQDDLDGQIESIDREIKTIKERRQEDAHREYDILDLAIQKRKGEIEIAIRAHFASLPEGDPLRVPDGYTVESHVDADEELCAMKKRLIDLDQQRSRSWSEIYETSEKLKELMEKQARLEQEKKEAYSEEQVLVAELETLKLLSQILTTQR